MSVFTFHAWGQTSTFGARSHEELATRLYIRTNWEWSVCVAHADDLMRGCVVTDPESETIVLPGDFEILELLEVAA